MKTAIVQADVILAVGDIETAPGRLRCGGAEYPLAALGDYTIESVPDDAAPGWRKTTGVWAEPIVPAAPEDIAAAMRDIDAICDAKRNRYVSPGTLVTEEYRLAAKQAAAFKDAGYAGQPPATVAAWAAAKGWAAKQATDDILATEAAWMAVLAAIRGIRLPAKEQARAAATRDALRAIVAGVRAALAQIPEE